MSRLDWEALSEAAAAGLLTVRSGGESPARPSRLAGNYRRAEEERRALGWHPSGIGPIAAGPGTCGTCAHRVPVDVPREDGEGVARHWKCEELRHRWTPGRKTDVLARWPGCRAWTPKNTQEQG